MIGNYVEHRKSERIPLHLNVLVLRTSSRVIGCRLLDISRSGAAIRLAGNRTEADSKGIPLSFEIGDSLEVLWRFRSFSETKNCRIAARTTRRDGRVIGVTFTENYSDVDELLKLYNSEKHQSTPDELSVEPNSDGFLTDSQPVDEHISLQPASGIKHSNEHGIKRYKSPMESDRPFLNWSIYIVGIIFLAGLAGYLYDVQRQLSQLTAALESESETLSKSNARLNLLEENWTSISQLDALVAVTREEIATLGDKIDRVSLAAARRASQLEEKFVTRKTDTPPIPPSPIPPSSIAPPKQAVLHPIPVAAEDISEKALTESKIASKIYVVTAAPLHVRKGPGTNYPVISKLNQGQKIPVKEIQDLWGRIEIQDQGVGWISLTYVTPAD